MAREKKSLQQNKKWGEDRQKHREHRSKRGRNKMFRDDSPIFLNKRKHLEEVKAGVDKYSLRLLRNRYKI